MKVTRAQAEANRAHVVATASQLFRERGFDGVGVADLMAAAGFTHGGFYKHFGSKADLMAESSACGIAQTLALAGDVEVAEFVAQYLSRQHRDDRARGCTLAALGGDAARQPDAVRAAFADGVEKIVAALGARLGPSAGAAGAAGAAAEGTAGGAGAETGAAPARARALDLLAHTVGAMVLSRACPDDSTLADEFLAACRHALAGAADARAPTPPAPARPAPRRAAPRSARPSAP